MSNLTVFNNERFGKARSILIRFGKVNIYHTDILKIVFDEALDSGLIRKAR